MVEIPLAAWKWLFENRANLKYTPDRQVTNFINVFMKNGLLNYEKGHFIFSPGLEQTLQNIEAEGLRLKEGAPISDKLTVTAPSEFELTLWYRGKTKESKSFLTDYSAVVMGKCLPWITQAESSNLFEIELVLSQVRHCIFREDYLILKPISFQREDYFTPGVVGFKGERNYTFSIAEEYYDLLQYKLRAVSNATQYLVVSLGYEVLVVTNPCVKVSDRYFEDIVAVIARCELEV